MNSKKNKPDPAEVPLDTFRSQAEARLVEFVNSDLLDNWFILYHQLITLPC